MNYQRLTLTAAAAAAAAGAVVGVPALTSAQTSGGKQIVVREKLRALRIVHQNASTKDDRLLMGDHVLTHQRLFNERNRAIGSLYTDCVNAGAPARVFSATLLCTASYRLAGGQFSTVGALRLGTGTPTPILGSGRYRGVHGEVASAPPVKGYKDVDVLRLDS
jgi:hypothetical protein